MKEVLGIVAKHERGGQHGLRWGKDKGDVAEIKDQRGIRLKGRVSK